MQLSEKLLIEKDMSAIHALNQIPGMTASIHDAANESLAQGIRFQDLDW